MAGCILRAAGENDLGAALSLVDAARAELYGLDRIPEILEDAVRGNAEYRACITDEDGVVTGVGVYGSVAGTVGTATVYAVIATKNEIARAVLDGILADLTSSGTRLVVAEFPGHESVAPYRALLEAAGFLEESSVDDYFEDGIPLVQYSLRPPEISGSV